VDTSRPGSSARAVDEGRCATLGGSLATLRYDVLGFVSRGLEESSGSKDGAASASVLRRLRTVLMPNQEQLRNGVALCLPASCREQEELVRVSMTYFTCLAGTCSDSSLLLEPAWPAELSLDLPLLLSETAAQPVAARRLVPVPMIVEPAAKATPVGLAPPLSPLAESAGCSADFVAAAVDLLTLSGLPAAGSADVGEQASALRKGCKALGGRQVYARIRILDYLTRQSATSEGSGVALHYMRSFYTAAVGAQLRRGIALCLPSSCQEDQQGLVKGAMAFATCITGRCADLEHLEDFIWGTDVFVAEPGAPGSVVAPVDVQPEGSTFGSETEEEGDQGPQGRSPSSGEGNTRCDQDFVPNMVEIFLISGLRFADVRSLEFGTLSPYANMQRRCAAIPGIFVSVQFDIMGYLRRQLEELAADGTFARQLWTFYIASSSSELLNLFTTGHAFCVPWSCLPALRTEIPHMAMAYMAWLARQTSLDGADVLTEPLLVSELNASISLEELQPAQKSRAGCGQDFVTNMAEIFAISGSLFSEVYALEVGGEQMNLWGTYAGIRGRCKSVGGIFIELQFDVLRYLKRQLEELGSGHHLAQRLWQYFSSDEESAALILGTFVSGLSFCLPKPCLDKLEGEVLHMGMLYCAWMATRGSLRGTEQLSAPILRLEMNATNPLQNHSPTQTFDFDFEGGSAEDEAQKACIVAWRNSTLAFKAASGAEVAFGFDEEMDEFYGQQRKCRALHGSYAVVRFFMHAYLGHDFGVLWPNRKIALEAFALSVRSENADSWATSGIGFCVPRLCRIDMRSTREVVLEYFGLASSKLRDVHVRYLPRGDFLGAFIQINPRVAGIRVLGGVGSWDLWWQREQHQWEASSMSEPRAQEQPHGGTERLQYLLGIGGPCHEVPTNASSCPEVFVDAAPTSAMPARGRSGGGGKGAGGVAVARGECGCIEEAPAPPALMAQPREDPTDFVTCSAAHFGPEWRAFRERLKSVPGDPGLDPSVISIADIIVQRHVWRALDWIVRSHQTQGMCSLPYVVFEGERKVSNFLPMLIFLLNSTDPYWMKWGSWLGFCWPGFIAALYYRARGLDAIGHTQEAIENLNMAQKMLGPCQEFDVLDARVWRISSLDVDFNLMRLHSTADDGRPIFSQAERPTGWAPYRSFVHNFPTKARIAQAYVWSALRQNTFYRRYYQAAAAECPAEVARAPPSLALLAWPSVFAVFMTPQIFDIWGEAVRLVVFHLGAWDHASHWEKCTECKKQLESRIPKEQAILRDSIPLKKDNPVLINWENEDGAIEFTSMDLVAALHLAFHSSEAFADASVLLCSSHLWMCLTIRLITEKPMLISDLANPNAGRPLDMKLRWYTKTARGVLNLGASNLKTLVLRDELLRAVLPTKGCTNDMDAESSRGEVECYDGSWEMPSFVPFGAQPSLYITARWQPDVALATSSGPFLVMREGSAGKFSRTMRGQFFFRTFKEIARASNLNVTLLIFDKTRLSFEDMAQYRAAITFPGITNAKRVPHDLYMMEIPLFFPSKQLFAASLASTGYYAAVSCDDGPWRRKRAREAVPPLCSWLRTAFQLELSSFYRLPHMFFFDSSADLARRLAGASDQELRMASRAMHHVSEQRIDDDLAFWQNAILAMSCASGRLGASAQASVPEPAHASASDPRCLFGIRSEDGAACCAIDCGACEERRCLDLPLGPEDCCPSRLVSAGHSCALHHAPCALPPHASDNAAEEAASSTCEGDLELCHPDVLQYSVHLDHRLKLFPPASVGSAT